MSNLKKQTPYHHEGDLSAGPLLASDDEGLVHCRGDVNDRGTHALVTYEDMDGVSRGVWVNLT